MTYKLVTEIDEFFDIVKKNGVITLEEVSNLMATEVELLERWSKALAEVGMITMDYPIVFFDAKKVKVKALDGY
jgi:predicted transcriptional regulator